PPADVICRFDSNYRYGRLEDVRGHDYPQLRRRDAISAWHIARAVHDCGLTRGALSCWLNQFAVRPDGWVGVVPGGEG
ncbi:MAG: hypothetical protein OXH79_12220, partial [Boseongicola sp.]|nr:hypothetical protein [Boseongicola sp.]